MSFLFTEKEPRKNSKWRYIWLCKSQRLDDNLTDGADHKKRWPQTNKVLVGRHYDNLGQSVYTPEFLDPSRDEIQGIPIPKDKQQEAIEAMNELRKKLGSNIPPAIRRYKKRDKPEEPKLVTMRDHKSEADIDTELDIQHPLQKVQTLGIA
jgi:hypothetical protein